MDDKEKTVEKDEFRRAENEDDDGYDPYSDRRPDPEPLFERDPWAYGRGGSKGTVPFDPSG